MTHALTSGMVHAGQVWLKDDNSAVVTQREGDDPPFLVTDWSTFLAQVADLENPALSSPALHAWRSSRRRAGRSRCAWAGGRA